MPFTKRTTDKDQAIDRAAYIAKNFEPNSNYEVDIMIRRDREDKRYWIITARLIFPHMHYKKKIVQESLLKGIRTKVIPTRRIIGPAACHMMRRYRSILDESQATLTKWTIA